MSTPTNQQLQMLDWLARELDRNESPNVDQLRMRLSQVGELPHDFEEMRQEALQMLDDPAALEADSYVKLSNLVGELSMMADPENGEGYSGPIRQLDPEWPLDPIEEMHHEITKNQD